MVSIKHAGAYWRATLTCTSCGTSSVTQHHLCSKPVVTVISIVKTTARTLGWKVGNETATCGACRRSQQ